MKKILMLTILLGTLLTQLLAQNRSVTGRVKGVDGAPLEGVNVLQKGTKQGVSTDNNGNFIIRLTGTGNILEISYTGYILQEIAANRQTIGDITLQPSGEKMEDVVVVGYGTQKKISVVGAISQVKPSELQQASAANLSNSLAGRVAGVITVMGSGKPGSDNAQIFIRGMATTNTTDPLVLVDGIERNWQQIDPVDIEAFSVLKDASATAVYGVRGANGVILITTKRGIKGKPVLSLSTQSALQQPIRTPKYLGSYDFALLTNESLRNDGKPEEYTAGDIQHYKVRDSPYSHPDNDYYNDFIKKASLQQLTNISVRGGNEVLAYFISANYAHQEGLYKDFPNSRYSTNSNYDRYNFRSNLDFFVSKNLQLGVDLTGRFEQRMQPNFDADLFDKIRRLPPNFQAYINPNGTMGGRSDETRLAPYALISSFGNRERNNNVLEGAFKLNQKLDMITRGLSFRTLVGFNSAYESRRDIVEKPELWEYNKFGVYLLNKAITETSISTGKGAAARRVSAEAALNYSRTFGDHAITGMALYQQIQNWNGGSVPTGYLGWVGRGTYAFRSKYLFEINAGYNGSNQFAKDHRYGFFPAVSAGWVASEEPFFKDHIPAVDFLKFRGSYGEIGNDKIGNFSYLYQQRYNYVPNSDGWIYYFGENPVAERGLVEGQPGNDRVSWERAKKANFGFDLKMLRSRLSATVDFFYEKRSDILAIPYSVPLVFGMNNPQGTTRTDGQGLPPENIGRVTNKGIDLEIGFNEKKGDFSYFIKGNFTYAKNIINKIDEEGKKYEWQKIQGKQIGQHFGLTDIGLFQLADFDLDANGALRLEGGFPVLKKGIPIPSYGVVFPGDAKYKDLNGDGLIDSYDVGNIGNGSVPQYSYGIYFGGSYRNFDISALIQGAGGADIYLKEDAMWEFFSLGKVMEHHLGRYNPDDAASWANATYPRLHPGENTNNHQKTTRWMFSRNYTRLKNIEVGYNLSKALLSRVKMSNARIFANGNNLITWDSVMNWDPESNSETGASYPQMRTWNLGVNVSF